MQVKSLLRAVFGVALLTLIADRSAISANYPRIFEAVWSRVNEDFYDPHFRGVDWAAARVHYYQELPGIRDDRAFSVLMDQMLGELHVSHVYLTPPNTSDAREVGVGIDLSIINGTRVVTDIAPLSDAHRAGLRVGDELEGVQDALYGAPGSTATLKVQGCDGTTRTIEVRRGARLHPFEHPGWRWSRLSFGPHQTLGYLRVDRFDDGAATLADQAMADMKGTDGLIIDVRQNSGGNNSALRLAGYFMPPGDAPIYALFARPYLKSLGREPKGADVMNGPKIEGAYTDAEVFKAVEEHKGAAVFYTEALGGDRYHHPVVVLIGENTGSAAEGFAWAMRLHSHATFIGHQTAGALLSGEEFPVGDGWTLTIPVQGLWGPDGRDVIDRAVSPDISVTWTSNDFCMGRDPALERASDILTSHSR